MFFYQFTAAESLNQNISCFVPSFQVIITEQGGHFFKYQISKMDTKMNHLKKKLKPYYCFLILFLLLPVNSWHWWSLFTNQSNSSYHEETPLKIKIYKNGLHSTLTIFSVFVFIKQGCFLFSDLCLYTREVKICILKGTVENWLVC